MRWLSIGLHTYLLVLDAARTFGECPVNAFSATTLWGICVSSNLAAPSGIYLAFHILQSVQQITKSLMSRSNGSEAAQLWNSFLVHSPPMYHSKRRPLVRSLIWANLSRLAWRMDSWERFAQDLCRSVGLILFWAPNSASSWNVSCKLNIDWKVHPRWRVMAYRM